MMMRDYDEVAKIKHIPNWPYILDHPYRVLIIGGSVEGKTNVLLNLKGKGLDIDKIHLYANDLLKSKYQLLINGRE